MRTERIPLRETASAARVTLVGIGLCLAASVLLQLSLRGVRIPLGPHLNVVTLAAGVVSFVVSRRRAGWEGLAGGGVAGMVLALTVGLLLAAVYVVTGLAAAHRVGPGLLIALFGASMAWGLGASIAGATLGQLRARSSAR